MVNRYPGLCAVRGENVPAKGGELVKRGRVWMPVHTAYQDAGSAQVTSTTFYGERGATTITRNRRGLCEDAPCCSCCSV